MASNANAKTKTKATGRAKSSKSGDGADLRKQNENLRAEVEILRNNFDRSKIPKTIVENQDLFAMVQESYTKMLEQIEELKKGEGVVTGSDAKSLEDKLQKTSKDLTESEKKRKTLEEQIDLMQKRLYTLEKSTPKQNSETINVDDSLVNELKNKIKELTDDNDKIRKELTAVREHNTDLKRKVTHLQDMNNSSNKNSSAHSDIVSGLEKKLTSKQQELAEQKKRNDEVQDELKQYRKGTEDEEQKQEEKTRLLQNEVQALEQKVKIMSETNDGVNDQREALLKQADELKKEKETEVSKLRDAQKKEEETKQEHEAEMSELKKQLNNKADLENIIDNLKIETARLNSRIKHLEEQAARKEETVSANEDSNRFRAMIQELQTEVERLKKEKEDLKADLKQHKNDLHEAFVSMEKKEKQIKNMEKQHKELVERKEETINKLRREASMGDVTGGKESPQVQELKRQVQSLKEDNDALQSRVSQMAGAKLQSSNPGITDLSDENRPTKLGEKFSELYDNEWTEAFEVQEETSGDEKKAIEHLLKILLNIYDFTQNLGKKHAEYLHKSCTSLSVKTSNSSKLPEIHLIQKKLLKDVLRTFAGCQVKDVIQYYLETNKSLSKENQKTMEFIQKAIEICWYMAVQDPPVVIDTSAKPADDFDGDAFKVYTKKGKKIDYVVWPPIRLHKEGHLIGKGVAQGK